MSRFSSLSISPVRSVHSSRISTVFCVQILSWISNCVYEPHTTTEAEYTSPKVAVDRGACSVSADERTKQNQQCGESTVNNSK